MRLLKTPCNLILNASSDVGGIHNFLGNLVQCLTTFIIKRFFLGFKLNLPSSSLNLLPLALRVLLKSLHPSYKPLLYMERPQEGLPRAFTSPDWTTPTLISLSS